MTILIVYGTTEGQTRKVARFISERIRDRSDEVTLIDSTNLPRDLDIDGSFRLRVMTPIISPWRRRGVVDWILQMRQFNHAASLDHLAEKHKLSRPLIKVESTFV